MTGSLTYGWKIAVDFYITPSYRYLSAKVDYSAGISVNITGKLTIREIPLGRIEMMPLPCINVGFTPSFVVEASGKLEWSGEIKGTFGKAYDSNIGYKNLFSVPKCQSSIKLEGKIFVGIKATPYVSIISADLAKASLGFSGGAEITATRSFFDSSKDVIHDCKNCLTGDIKGKLSLEMTVDIIKKKKDTTEPLELSAKIADFYYSFDWNELGWGTCPYICNAVEISVKDTNGNNVPGVITITVTDKKSGETVDIREGYNSFKDSIELTGSEEKKVYLPDGSYVVHAVNDGDMKAEANFTVHGRGTEVVVKMKLEEGNGSTDEPSTGKDGNITWRLTKDGTLYIEGSGNMPYYKYNNNIGTAPWFQDRECIENVIIKEGITSIGIEAFAGCINLKQVDISETVANIGNGAFEGCCNLSKIKIPNKVTEISDIVFRDCSNLESIEIPEGVTLIGGGAFLNCSNLSSIELPESVIYIGMNAFSECSSLSSINIPKGVTNIGDGAFEGCSNLRAVEIPEGVRSIGIHTFKNCYKISSLEIPKEVTIIGFSAFENLGSLSTEKNVTIYFKGNRPKVTRAGWGTEYTKFDIFSGLSNATIYYPQNNSTWDGIEDESFGGINIKWVTYDSTSLNTVSVDVEANSDDSEIQSEEPEFADDVNSSDDEDQGQTDDASESDDVIVEEEPEDIFAADDEEITEVITPPVSYAQDEQMLDSSMMFSKLVPQSRYLFVMVKDENAEDLLEASNLLYIGQKTADETGTISFRYMLRENFNSPASKVFGDVLKEIRNAKVSLSETSYVYDGKAKTPYVTVQDGEYILQNGVDYTVTYSNNVNAGTATVTITGKGRYTGSIDINFEIQPLSGNNESKETKNDSKITKKDNVIKAANIVKNVSGKAQTVNINAKVNDGAKLTYSSNSRSVKVNAKGKVTIANKFIGKAVITITAAETAEYNKTSRRITVTVRPKGTKLSGLSNTIKGNVKITWKRNKAVTGYRIQYSTDKKFKKVVKYVNISKNKKTTTTLSKLKKGKTYYVRIATYKKTGGKVYSSWSKVKKIKIEK